MLTRDQAETLTVESRTVEEALQAISEKLGPDVEVIGAQKVVRGGVGGFFSKEMVQISARPAAAGPRSRLDAAYDDIVGAEEAGENEFHELLRSRLTAEPAVEIELPADAAGDDVRVTLHGAGETGDEAAVVAAMLAGPVAPAAQPAPEAAQPATPVAAPQPAPVATPATAPPAPQPVPVATLAPPEPAPVAAHPEPLRTAAPLQPATAPIAGEWRLDALLALRLPAGIIRACDGLAPGDDLDWVGAIATASSALCGDLDDGPTVLAGPGAHHLAATLGLPAVRAGEAAPPTGSFAATVHPGTAERDWLVAAMGGRRLHLVVGDHDWEPLMVQRPVAVSWTGDRALPGALYLAAALGIPLGFGATGGFPVGVARVDPVDVALAIRRLARL